MFGPLPRLYRLIVVAAAVVLSIGTGLWLALAYDLPFGGLLVGTAAGLVIAFTLIHDFTHHQTRPARAVRRR